VIKTIALAYRKESLTREQYNKHWLEKHAPLAVKYIPYMKKYVQNHFIEVPGMEYEGDGIVEMWYDSVEDWQKSRDALSSFPELMKDGASFARMHPGGFWVVEEHVILDNTEK
jgi:uncharacterized protein (TIGR02118 family)